MAKQVSLLIFSRNDIDAALGLIREMYDVADDIVIVDSSRRAQHGRLWRAKRRERLDHLRIYYVVPLGYPDPLRMYAIRKCRNEWVLLLDTNERLSKPMKSCLLDTIANAECDAFAFKRYESVSAEGSKMKFFTWQIRLFKKGRVSFKGVPHEQAIVNGDLERLEREDLYIEHRLDLMHRELSVYHKLLTGFGRMSYGTFNRRMLYYLYKVQMPRRIDRPTLTARLLSGVLTTYERIRSRDLKKELTFSDYVNYFMLLNGSYALKQLNVHALIFDILPSAKMGALELLEPTMGLTGEQIFRVSEAINNEGLTKVLGLDKDSTIRSLNLKYKNDDRGIDLLIDLLVIWAKRKYPSRGLPAQRSGPAPSATPSFTENLARQARRELRKCKTMSEFCYNGTDFVLWRLGLVSRVALRFKDGSAVTVANKRQLSALWDSPNVLRMEASRLHPKITKDHIRLPKRYTGVRKDLTFFYGSQQMLAQYLRSLRELFLEGEYSKLNADGKVVVDIGAKLGDTAIYLAAKGAKSVIAVEPRELLYKAAKKNVILNGFQNRIVVVNAALMQKRVYSAVDRKSNEAEGNGKAKILSLQDLISTYGLRNVVLNLDMGGGEYDVLRNAPILALRFFSEILIRYRGSAKPLKMKLRRAGYRVRSDNANLLHATKLY
jgi:FkbM family methyltransferase